MLFPVSLQCGKKPEISGHPACCASSAWHRSPISVRWVFATITAALQTAEGFWSHSLVTAVLLPARATCFITTCLIWSARFGNHNASSRFLSSPGQKRNLLYYPVISLFSHSLFFGNQYFLLPLPAQNKHASLGKNWKAYASEVFLENGW